MAASERYSILFFYLYFPSHTELVCAHSVLFVVLLCFMFLSRLIWISNRFKSFSEHISSGTVVNCMSLWKTCIISPFSSLLIQWRIQDFRLEGLPPLTKISSFGRWGWGGGRRRRPLFLIFLCEEIIYQVILSLPSSGLLVQTSLRAY